MLKKLLLLLLLFAFSYNFVQADGRLIPQAQYDKIVGMQYKVKIVGDALVGERMDGKVHNDVTVYRPTVISLYTSPFTITYGESDFVTTTTYTPTTGQSIYDMQSNGSAVHLWQNPINPDQVH